MRAGFLNRGSWEVGLGRSKMHPTVLLCAPTSMCFCVCMCVCEYGQIGGSGSGGGV